MKLSEFTVSTLVRFFAESTDPREQLNLTPYMSGTKLISFFNKVGCQDIYNNGMPDGMSRATYVQTRLNELSGSNKLVMAIENLFDNRHFSSDPGKDIDFAALEFNKLILPDGYRIEKIEGIYKVIGADPPEQIEVEIYFEDIEAQIIDQINKAKFLIWIAVAWFTNRNLANALHKKIGEGINVRLIVLDDKINREDGFQYEKLCETKRILPNGTFNNIMHHKFCIIDLETVIVGSYNWTNKANWNKENISIEFSRELAKSYASRFIDLIK